jgi:hypothetical protein
MMPTITLADAPAAEMRRAILAPLVEFNEAHAGPRKITGRWQF